MKSGDKFREVKFFVRFFAELVLTAICVFGPLCGWVQISEGAWVGCESRKDAVALPEGAAA